MSNDQFWRIVIGSLLIGVIGAFRPQIAKWLRSIGYKGWR